MTKEKILNILEQINPDADYENSDDFFEDELMDSMGIMTMITMIENTFSITIEPEDITADNFLNISCITKMLETYL